MVSLKIENFLNEMNYLAENIPGSVWRGLSGFFLLLIIIGVRREMVYRTNHLIPR